LKNTSGEYCDYYGWINVIDIYKRGDYRSPDKKKSLVKCRHVVNMNDTCGFIRYFSPSDIINTDECKRMNREYLIQIKSERIKVRVATKDMSPFW
jgi:hypothetical protein